MLWQLGSKRNQFLTLISKCRHPSNPHAHCKAARTFNSGRKFGFSDTYLLFFWFAIDWVEFFMQHGIAALHLKTFVDWANLGKLSIAIKPLMILEYWNRADMHSIRPTLIFACSKWRIVIDAAENKNNNENCLKDKVAIGDLILSRSVLTSILVRWPRMYAREHLVIENSSNVHLHGTCQSIFWH